MMQYYTIKELHPNALLLFRVGDYYETFSNDALCLHEAIPEITLSSKPIGIHERTRLTGLHMNRLEEYLPRLVGKGIQVALCEQLEDPKQSKSVNRSIQ